MIPKSYEMLVKSLIEKTKSGKSSWNKTSVKDQYKLILNTGMVVLTYKDDVIDGKIIYLDIYDNAGQLVGSISADYAYNRPDFVILNDLYNSILRIKELKINEQISILMDEINTSDKIGKEN